MKKKKERGLSEAKGNENGDPSLLLDERLDHIDIIRFFIEEDNRISEKVVQEYQKGQSISDIAKVLGRSKSFVKLRLERAGIEPREKLSQATHVRRIKRGKSWSWAALQNIVGRLRRKV